MTYNHISIDEKKPNFHQKGFFRISRPLRRENDYYPFVASRVVCKSGVSFNTR